ncbi:bifunctional [glutamate--ammonia ligase]-adenylyl-L-tyrosine phosphorylase/[glutamate--ammonia-ligase] adenylyltransferase [[Haemophilus] felis]|uniref:Bifunctional glutamine synthetase adenylyltransferase/adenylyl-removing enzyme n=1 Tax=[Haemophilus] felis TaxID=123822 RepID=A0A1T0B5W5_9PAST|nr:bifunctional [glutamate--ammonia ligase]-adenylyl-L-tyrosine phosphorylase/[glutamate--ammonia-ligase] adenylyltransferase [[Haemophilus] felis]NBI40824.1 bifunctional [glutamate--ammonia ligase]-adenylyl-L-tyrosine phosphorylase/[glutamate--ammonia-ligase] adenylyltransferase [[Haemophilus] felis]OOS05528.1 bifunctional glutamine synthetase adenylyltransferase/deadenyltransferase [[Haemophilus] felis]
MLLPISQFSEPLNQFAQILIAHFPEQISHSIFTTIEKEQENLDSNIGKIAYAVAMSDFFAEVLKKYPQFLLACWQQTPNFSDCDNYFKRLNKLLAMVEEEAELHRILRQFRYQEMAKLSFCQSLNLASVEQIFVRLSQLAESLIIGARDWLYKKACEEMGTPQDSNGKPMQLYILGMGKLGGFELNFSSDIDLIFTYPANGETQGARKPIEHSKFFTRLGQRLIQALDEFTADGFVYRTDMRLRPFGENGALALSFDAMEQYYQDQGRDWERYAMIKGRVLGMQQQDPHTQYLQKMLRPFVYRRYIDFSVIQALREMKGKIEREVRRRGLVDDIKLGAGGIREIEFIVQVFQLIRGGRELSLQSHQLLKLLPALSQLDLISEEQQQHLQQAYLFLRRTENILQAINDQQTQQLPENELDRLRLVQATQRFTQQNSQQQIEWVNYPIQDWASFYGVLQQHQQNVRNIFNNLIGAEKEEVEQNKSKQENSWLDFLDPDLSSQELEQLLAPLALNEADFEQILQRLIRFKAELIRRPIGARGRDVLNQLMPNLLQQIFQQQGPTLLVNVLTRMLNIVEQILTRTTYLELLLEHPQALEQLIELCAKSKLIAEQVARHPILLDELLDRKTLLNPPPYQQYADELKQYLLRLDPDDEEQILDGLRQFKQATLLRVACADILGALPVMKVSDHLTFLAEAIIEAVVNLAWKQVTARFGVPEHLAENEKGFLVIGYGKLGGIELGYKSDLDLVFLFESVANSQTIGAKRSLDSNQFYLRLAQKILSIFSLNTFTGVLYEVDMRLRPSGESGLLCSSINAFQDYQLNQAWTWEKQALVRSRAVYGELELREQFEQIRQQVLSSPRDVACLKQDVVAMREKMYNHLTHHNEQQFNLKTDRGGITDIEFLAQYLVLAHAPQNPALSIWSDNVRIFDVMAESAVISSQVCTQLKQCYVDLRNEIHHLNLLGLPSVLPNSSFQTERTFIQQIWHQLLHSDLKP